MYSFGVGVNMNGLEFLIHSKILSLYFNVLSIQGYKA